MECGSGAGGRHSEQACGLSGLWDIRRPCMWGSMWYWDVNIQTAFYGSFASNHMEQVKVFCDAFLSYREEAFRFAERIYGERGWALDYPHPLYNCIQPWCGLFLWQYYAYTQDTEFLREKAYPAFCGMLAACSDDDWKDDVSALQQPVPSSIVMLDEAGGTIVKGNSFQLRFRVNPSSVVLTKDDV